MERRRRKKTALDRNKHRWEDELHPFIHFLIRFFVSSSPQSYVNSTFFPFSVRRDETRKREKEIAHHLQIQIQFNHLHLFRLVFFVSSFFVFVSWYTLAFMCRCIIQVMESRKRGRWRWNNDAEGNENEITSERKGTERREKVKEVRNQETFLLSFAWTRHLPGKERRLAISGESEKR